MYPERLTLANRTFWRQKGERYMYSCQIGIRHGIVSDNIWLNNEKGEKMIEYRIKFNGKIITLATNDNGEGLFIFGHSSDVTGGSSWKQLKGICDFSLKGIKHPDAKLRRYLKEAGLPWHFVPLTI